MKRGKLWSSQLNFWMVNCYKVVDGKNCKFFSFFFSESSKCRYIHCLPLLDSIDCHLWLPLFNNISTLSQYYQYYYYLFPPWNIIIIIMLNALWVTFMYSADQNFLSLSLLLPLVLSYYYYYYYEHCDLLFCLIKSRKKTWWRWRLNREGKKICKW